MEEKLRQRFGICEVDIFDPTKLKHRTHAGMAKVVCEENHAFGERHELNLGFRYPVFVKDSKRKAMKILQKRERHKSWNLRF